MQAEVADFFHCDVELVRNSVLIDSVQPEPVQTARPFFLTVGTLEPRKNLSSLVKAYDESGLSKEIDLVVVGRKAWDGPPPVGVVWMHGLSDGQLRWMFESALAFFSASLYEGFGLPVAEAAALGVPAFVSNIPAYREVGGEIVKAFFEPQDTATMVDCLRSAASEGPQRLPKVNNYSIWHMRQDFQALHTTVS
ncbi:glycosyltransferase [Nocardioidaceae bacterium]|nr:glycosyltransferase [Nocardioidaceae bacterium]